MKPSTNYIALNRATFGATLEELALVEKIGSSVWVVGQLKLDAVAKDEASERIAAHKQHIEYEFEGEMAPAMMMPAGKMNIISGGKAAMMTEAPANSGDEAKPKGKPKHKFKVDEKRGLAMPDKPLDQFFRAQNQEDYPYQEINRCTYEVEVASIIHACYPKWQVSELLVDFCHNYFNVNIDAAIRAGGHKVS